MSQSEFSEKPIEPTGSDYPNEAHVQRGAEYILPEQVTVNFYFSPHGIADDAPNLKQRIAETDIFAPETLGWTPEQHKAFTRISRGDHKAFERLRHSIRSEKGSDSYTELLISALYNKRIPVIMFDTEEQNPLTRNFKYYSGMLALSRALHPDYAQTIKGLRELYGRDYGRATRQREEYMLGSLTTQARTITDNHPKLRCKPEISMLVALGSDHTYLYHRLKKDNPESKISREFGDTPVVYPFQVRALRSGQFGTELTDQRVAQAYAEIIVKAIVRKEQISLPGRSEVERDRRIMSAVDSLDIDEIALLHHSFQRTLDTSGQYNLDDPTIARIVSRLTV